MSNEIGIAGWAFHRAIQQDKTMTLLDLPAVCRELGATTIELVSTFFESQQARYLNALRQAIETQGQQVRNIAVDMGNIANPDAAVRNTDLEAIKQWFHVARAVGSQAIRVNSGAARPDDSEAIKRITDGYRELAEEAAHSGVYLLIENHGGASADPRNIQAFLDGVGSPWFRTCPDVSNFSGDTWEEGMRLMAPQAFTCHIKAWNADPSGKQQRVDREGKTQAFDLRRCLQILQEAGYNGPLCVEYGDWQDEREGARDLMRYTREILATL
ncbi:MAG TPA: sugar phosphate isomerase/epimerase family protein [Chloroflexota bacterium]|nr:sugar phosphate isomerase/epimerase family protein [Chloroflexota bacterium]